MIENILNYLKKDPMINEVRMIYYDMFSEKYNDLQVNNIHTICSENNIKYKMTIICNIENTIKKMKSINKDFRKKYTTVGISEKSENNNIFFIYTLKEEQLNYFLQKLFMTTGYSNWSFDYYKYFSTNLECEKREDLIEKNVFVFLKRKPDENLIQISTYNGSIFTINYRGNAKYSVFVENPNTSILCLLEENGIMSYQELRNIDNEMKYIKVVTNKKSLKNFIYDIAFDCELRKFYPK